VENQDISKSEKVSVAAPTKENTVRKSIEEKEIRKNYTP
jgi:hypothetical protein